MTIHLKGVIPPMITPFTKEGDLDESGFIQNIQRWNQTGLSGYLVLGSNSETVYLTEKEKIRLMELTVQHASENRVLLAGTGMESTRDTIELTQKAAELGIHAALVLTPFYYGGKMTDEALIRYYTEVADHAAIPILIYNVSKFTHINITPGAVSILSRHPNIVGMKDSAGDIPQLVRYMKVVAEDFSLLVGTASAWYPALTLGIKGGIMALANCAPDACVEIQQLFDQGDWMAARELYTQVFFLNDAVTGKYGVAGLKEACRLVGYTGGEVRSPLLPLEESEKRAVEKLVKEAVLPIIA